MRWLVVGGFAAYALYALVEGMFFLAKQQEPHWAVRWLLFAPVLIAGCGILLAISYFTYTRQYERLCRLAAVVVAGAAFLCAISAPDWLGIGGLDRPQSGTFALRAMIDVAAFVLGWVAARWVHRRARAFLFTHVLHQPL